MNLGEFSIFIVSASDQGVTIGIIKNRRTEPQSTTVGEK